ncbi:MAG: hypothetical protein M1832_003047 [Thelocarpon impressellum]|nr:MAG: hypothetical protein M1832_003047 [Thelocarpon impressellum]
MSAYCRPVARNLYPGAHPWQYSLEPNNMTSLSVASDDDHDRFSHGSYSPSPSGLQDHRQKSNGSSARDERRQLSQGSYVASLAPQRGRHQASQVSYLVDRPAQETPRQRQYSPVSYPVDDPSEDTPRQYSTESYRPARSAPKDSLRVREMNGNLDRLSDLLAEHCMDNASNCRTPRTPFAPNTPHTLGTPHAGTRANSRTPHSQVEDCGASTGWTSFEEAQSLYSPSRNSSWGNESSNTTRRWADGEVYQGLGTLAEVDLNASYEDIYAQAKAAPSTPPRRGSENVTQRVPSSADRRSRALPLPTDDSLTFDSEYVSEGIPFPQSRKQKPFKRWVSTLRRQSLTRKISQVPSILRQHFDDGDETPRPPEGDKSRRKGSSSFSSMGFVTAIKTASVSLASINAPSRSRRHGASSHARSADRSNRSSNQDAATSFEATGARPAPSIDDEVRERAIQRRCILEELISSEESYIADMKILVNVYFTMLASVPALSTDTRSSIRRNVMEILELHEELLGELHQVIPNSEYAQDQAAHTLSAELGGHAKFRSLNRVPDDFADLVGDFRAKLSSDTAYHVAPHVAPYDAALKADAKVAADVARIFQKLMKRFFAYEEYGAKYEMMIKDVASTYKAIPSWTAYEKGIEALAISITSINGRAASDRKSLTFGDLLIKACPRAGLTKLEKVILRLRETTREINKATDDPQARAKIEKTWLLQDKLVFPDQTRASQAVTLRLLGHVSLCGVLHVAWQTPTGVQGEYMLCALFRTNLILATYHRAKGKFVVVACIDLANVKVESADNGRGLQCHTAPHTFKLVFESENKLHEMLLSACSDAEESAWKQGLKAGAAIETGDDFSIEATTQDLLPFLFLDVKPAGNVFGQRGTLARRISIHRATTVGPKTSITHVIIKNTHTLVEGQEAPLYPSASIIRSQSLLATNRTTTLAPKRTERMRLEGLLGDVWTREQIPYPGMEAGKPEHAIKLSASSMMRKLSMASITSKYSRRS